jgi:biopolymer transport protein ExbD
MTGLAAILPRRRRARVEIIPLIDVIFFLLATFVLLTLSMNRIVALPLDLPSRPVPGAPPSEALVLCVSGGGILNWDRDVITRMDLPARLADYQRTTLDPCIVIAGDRLAPFGAVAEVLDEVRRAGITKVTFDMKVAATIR